MYVSLSKWVNEKQCYNALLSGRKYYTGEDHHDVSPTFFLQMKTAAAPVMRLVPSFSAVRLLFNFWSHHLFLFFCVLLQSDLGLTQSVDSCLQLNLVYQQVMQETLDQLEVLLKTNQKQQVSRDAQPLTHSRRHSQRQMLGFHTSCPSLQEELIAQMSGPYKESSRGQLARSTYQQPVRMFLGRFLKPYFKDKLTGLVRQINTHPFCF